MLSKLINSSRRGTRALGRRRLAITGGVAIAVVAAPIALAAPIQGGQRNPGTDTSVSYSEQTQIIADNSSWGTRQSNKGTGGGAIYGCRSASNANACIEADNLNSGIAFNFDTQGNVGGTITLANPAGSPLTTNATGVATGFNANFLQGKQASAFLPATAQAVDSAKLGGVAAASYAQGQLLFADVDATGKLGNTRGATAAAVSTTSSQTFTVTFSGDVSKCSYTASPLGAALPSGSLGVGPDLTNPNIVDVLLPANTSTGFSLQVIC